VLASLVALAVAQHRYDALGFGAIEFWLLNRLP
jgi:hypothetical protein